MGWTLRARQQAEQQDEGDGSDAHRAEHSGREVPEPLGPPPPRLDARDDPTDRLTDHCQHRLAGYQRRNDPSEG